MSSGGEVSNGTTTNVVYADTGLANGTTYYYEISAQNLLGQSSNSGEVAATPQPPAPGSYATARGVRCICYTNGQPVPSLPSGSRVVVKHYRSKLFTGTFTGTGLLWILQLVALEQLGVGGEGRNRTRPACHKPLKINRLNHHRCIDNKGDSAFCQR